MIGAADDDVVTPFQQVTVTVVADPPTAVYDVLQTAPLVRFRTLVHRYDLDGRDAAPQAWTVPAWMVDVYQLPPPTDGSPPRAPTRFDRRSTSVQRRPTVAEQMALRLDQACTVVESRAVGYDAADKPAAVRVRVIPRRDPDHPAAVDIPQEQETIMADGPYRPPTSRPQQTIPVLLPGEPEVYITGRFPISPPAWADLLGVLDAMKPGLVADDPTDGGAP